MPRIAGIMALGVMLLSIMSPIMRYWSPTGNAAFMIAALIPVALYALVMALSWRKHVDNNVLEDDDARRILLQLGIQTFACMAPLGLLGYQSGNIVGVLRVLSPVLCAMAGPALMIGLLLWRRFPAKLTGTHRTTAAAIALVASAVMLLGVAAAWPVPSSVLPALLVNAVAICGLAWKSRRPEAHGAAAAVGSLILVFAAQLLLGRVGWNET
ncbi:MAG: hypothetical protein IPK83_12780, partial [Planctomycetes bacterium]|nr:hypothetical protein [Planctomycetota bacterium]